ncbi:hypothetical protein HYT33_01090 [Candidatus Roizmanbacteria bacterium]|nr:hypothetical protein [Candidatus Roizmanbacteria bacterium]
MAFKERVRRMFFSPELTAGDLPFDVESLVEKINKDGAYVARGPFYPRDLEGKISFMFVAPKMRMYGSRELKELQKKFTDRLEATIALENKEISTTVYTHRETFPSVEEEWNHVRIIPGKISFQPKESASIVPYVEIKFFADPAIVRQSANRLMRIERRRRLNLDDVIPEYIRAPVIPLKLAPAK